MLCNECWNQKKCNLDRKITIKNNNVVSCSKFDPIKDCETLEVRINELEKKMENWVNNHCGGGF